MKVCIDPGHGMSNRTLNVFDPGATHTESTTLHKEAEIALKYGLTLKDTFRAKGVSIFMTRDDDTDHAPVGKRAEAAENANCEAFISLHLNDFDDDSANGTEVLYRDNNDRTLATRIQSAMIGITGLRDRGVKQRTDLAVLKFNGPAVLIELGFIANDADRKKLLEPQTRSALCESIANTTMNHMGWPVTAPAAPALAPGAIPAAMAVPVMAGTEGNENDTDANAPHAFILTDPLIQGDLPLTVQNFTNTFGPMALSPGFNLAAFEALVLSWGLRYFSPAELLYLGASHHAGGACGGLNTMPPTGKWNRMKLTALMADEIRHRFGHPIRIISGYRSPAYNSCISGAGGSFHMEFNALDLTNEGGTVANMHAIARGLRAGNPAFTGGIGRYNSFIHIDTRGTYSDW